jgi:SAM-dependent methyltransferase
LVRRVYLGLRSVACRGNAVTCPCCGGRFGHFLAYGVDRPRPNAQCPSCGSLERHHLLRLYLERELNHLPTRATLLHIAAESFLMDWLQSVADLRYVAVDLRLPGAMVHADVSCLPFPAEAFDLVVCSHVLEHVPDDLAAMGELARVLRPKGRAVIQVPLDVWRARTLEDPAIASSRARERLYGAHDHVRRYGADLLDRLHQAGLLAARLQPTDDLGERARRAHGLAEGDATFIGVKPDTSPRPAQPNSEA